MYLWKYEKKYQWIKYQYSPISLLSSVCMVTILSAVAAGERKLCKNKWGTRKER